MGYVLCGPSKQVGWSFWGMTTLPILALEEGARKERAVKGGFGRPNQY